MKKILLVLSAVLLGGQASAQESYVYGGLGFGQADFDYTYTPFSENTGFDADGTNVFLGYGRVFSSNGQVAFAGEVDVSFGDIESDLVLADTAPCFFDEDGCTGTVSTLATMRVVAMADSGALRPFATLGLAYGKVEGTADLGACELDRCAFDEGQFGFTAGLGATYEINASWRFRGEYLYVDLGEPEFSNRVNVISDKIQVNQVRLGAEYRF